MYLADLEHPEPSLQDKLTQLYNLRPGKEIELGFRKAFLDLLTAYGNPQNHLPPTIHVAGTNGKGSMIATLRAILEASGKTVSAFTSPHLLQFNERLYIRGAHIDNDALENAINRALELNGSAETSFFEITTAMALSAFTQTPADALLLEVGMGGRLDCTNIIEKPVVTIIGNISYDHQQYLGDTLNEIAAEKAGIMKTSVPCIIAPQNDENIVKVFEDRAAELSVPLYIAERDWKAYETPDGMVFETDNQSWELPRSALLGSHQTGNAGAALMASYVTQDTFSWDHGNIASGLAQVTWPGRLQEIKPNIWYDGGCNDSAGQALAAQIETWKNKDARPLHLIIGMKGDKNPDTFLSHLLPFAETCTVICVDKISQSLTLDDISELTVQHPSCAFAKADSVDAAIAQINKTCAQEKRVLICGSLYLAAQIL